MFSSRISLVSNHNRISHSLKRLLSKSPKYLLQNKDPSEFENPIKRTLRILGADLMHVYKNVTQQPTSIPLGVPSHTDVLIVGGGAIGSSIAYWLKDKSNADSFEVLVVEKDPSYSNSTTALSVGGLYQQFSLPENVEMSLFGFEFIRTLKRRFGPEADARFTPHGCLTLSTEYDAEQLLENSKLQNELGASNIVLQKHQLKERFPWLNVDDVELGCFGLEKEGWFDPWSLLKWMKRGSEEKMTRYIDGDLVGFIFDERHDLFIEGVNQRVIEHPKAALVKMANGELKKIHFAICVIASGADSGKVAEHLKIGTGSGLLSLPLPIEKRKRYMYEFECDKDPPGLNVPLTMDYTGAFFRREGLGGKFIGGIALSPEHDQETTNLDVIHDYFDRHLWPILANRVPAFNDLKVSGAWSGFYEYNTFDENGIVGPHPFYTNIYIASGFSEHGIQHAPAIGRAVSELILDGRFQTIDLARLAFDRFLVQKPLLESKVL